jgi:hypothetical protein
MMDVKGTYNVLKEHRDNLLFDLLKSYPDDFRLKMLVDLCKLEPIPVSFPLVASRPTESNVRCYKDDERVESVVSAGIAVFRESVTYPAYCRSIIPMLRDAGAVLPEDEVRATSIVSAIFAKRPDIFKKFPGSGQKATGRWQLVTCVQGNTPILVSNDKPKQGMSEENRKKAAERMKQLWTSGKMKRVSEQP